MQKRSLEERLRGKNDYSIFSVEKPEFIKYPLKQITDTSYRSDYHKARIDQTIRCFQALNSLTVSEYFKYFPDYIDRLKWSPFIDTDKEDMVSEMTVGQVLYAFGSKIDDFEHDYAVSLASVLTAPVRDSKYTHPLFKSLFINNREMVKMMTADKKGCYKSGTEKFLYISLNDYLRELDRKSVICDNGEHTFAKYFDNVVIPSMAVTTFR